MKNLKFAFAFLLAAIFASCEKYDINYGKEYDKSYNEWVGFKETNGNSYSYSVLGSSWIGPSWQTEITVANGKVVKRYFKYTSLAGLENVPKEAVEWTENEKEINSHEYTAAANALTLDQVYDRARSLWLLKRTNATTYFETKNNGMISLCGYIENNCADDCFRGVKIENIKALNTK